MSSPSHAAWRSRAARVCACALLTLSLAGASAPAALSAGGSAAEGGAFNELSKAGQEEPAQTQKTETTASTAPVSNSKKTVIIAIGAAVVLLTAIALVIVRDAHRTAPAVDPGLTEERAARDMAVTMRKRRAKAKAARKQRKRTR